VSRHRRGTDEEDVRPEVEDLEDKTMRIAIPKRGPVHRTSVAALRVVAGRDMLRFATLEPGEELLIGRKDMCDLQLTDITVSSRHALVKADADGKVTIEDLDSTNGTAVNGEQIRNATIRTGDHLECGAVSLRLDTLSLDELGHLSRVLERLEAANTDPLTGLLRRGFITDGLSTLVDRCTEAGVPISCAFVDADRFKNINDQYGHQVGDEVLSAISRLIMIALRDADPCVRYGGEEILIFIPGTTEAAATTVTDRIRRAIAGHDWERTAPGLQVTASFGVAQYDPNASIKEWIHKSDEAVYAAKHAGRNRVVPFSSIPR